MVHRTPDYINDCSQANRAAQTVYTSLNSHLQSSLFYIVKLNQVDELKTKERLWRNFILKSIKPKLKTSNCGQKTPSTPNYVVTVLNANLHLLPCMCRAGFWKESSRLLRHSGEVQAIEQLILQMMSNGPDHWQSNSLRVTWFTLQFSWDNHGPDVRPGFTELLKLCKHQANILKVHTLLQWYSHTHTHVYFYVYTLSQICTRMP